MGLGDIISNTLLKVKADTSQAKAEIRSLRGTERQAAKERLSELEKTNKGIDDQIAFYGKLIGIVGGGVAAFKLAQGAARAYLEDVRLESAAAGVSLDRLQRATLGLVEADNLLAFAGKAQAGVWKLNQGEMETVLRGATALRKTMGVELQPTIEKLTDAIAKGSTNALKGLGIEAKDKQGTLRELDALFASIGGNASLAGDEMQAAGVSIADSMDDAAGAMGAAVLKLAPLVQGIAMLVSALGDFVQMVGNLPDWLIPDSSDGGRLSARDQRLQQGSAYRSRARTLRQRAQIPGYTTGRELGDEYNNGMVTLLTGSGDAIREGLLKEAAWLDAQAQHILGPDLAKAAMASLATVNQALVSAQKTAGADAAKAIAGGGRGGALSVELLGPSFRLAPGPGKGLDHDFSGGLGGVDSLGTSTDLQAQMAAMAQAAELAEVQRQKGRTALESLFGTPAEVDEMASALKVASTAFEGLAGAAAAGFDAWITGQESMSKAFSKAIAEMLRALASQMLIESLKHTAMGFGALAIPGLQIGAGAHFKAAGLYAGVALAAGVAAKGIGASTGQWSQGGGASARGSSAPARTIGNGAGGGNQPAAPITFYVGAEWASMSSIDQAASVTRMLQLGKRGSPHIRRH